MIDRSRAAESIFLQKIIANDKRQIILLRQAPILVITGTFIFTDGIYTFSTHLKMQGKGSNLKLEVFDLPPVSIVKSGKVLPKKGRNIA